MTLGVAVSRAGVASIAGALKGCLDMLSDISCLNALQHDWPLLQAKLDVEKTLLLQWADKVKLLGEPHDNRLNDLHIFNQALKLFRNTRTLLHDKPMLEGRCRLLMFELEDTLPDATYLVSSPILSKPRLDNFYMEYIGRNLDALQLPDSTLPSTKYRRVVSDPEGFERFLEQVRLLVNGLNRLSSSANCLGCSADMAREDVRRCKTMDDLRMMRNAAMGVRDTIAHAAEELIVYLARRRVLKNLAFTGMHERKANLKHAHPGTFEWAFKPPQDDVYWNDLGEWLESGSDIYWVCGKAGVGKSTFLKYLYDHPETRRRLAVWAGDEPVSVGSFFFWKMGTSVQKCRDGMARAVLHHVLSEIPTLIPYIVPTLWRLAYGGGTYEIHETLPLPSIPEVRMAFERMAEDGVLDRHFCFIVDALDEYGGANERAVNFLERLTLSPKIKVVASSRPTPAFVKLFAKAPKLHLHDLTRGDVLQFVREITNIHLYMGKLRAADETRALTLVDTLAERAHGIFLWAILATRVLFQGFGNKEPFGVLELRVEDMPEELDGVYGHMLRLLDPCQREKAAKILRVCYRTRKSRSNQGEPRRIWATGLAPAAVNGTDYDDFELHAERTLQTRHKQCLALENRIANRCNGLLEVVGDVDGPVPCSCPTPEEHPIDDDIVINSSIEFIHRTAFEWYDRLDARAMLSLGIRGHDFQEDTCLAPMSWQKCRMWYGTEAPFTQANMDLANCMYHMEDAAELSNKSADEILAKIHQLVVDTRLRRGENWHYSFCCSNVRPVTERLQTLYFAIGMGMVDFVRNYMERNPDGPTLHEMEQQHTMCWWRVVADRSLVSNFLEPFSEIIVRLPPQGPMLEYLASAGCNVPSNEMQYYLRDESLDNYTNSILAA
ncbi:hypothetical protein N0V84_012044 [Fusarium piperis]|uniref:Prion-inhibition and propagation HeLo domain-containing protein n=1 Tax=Fusarium piperis TaxID=1435070 RepID=A0A9W8TAZ9_9HYPO|nr:hypothetical protein N0V84_012044 [Fusarium piperis]